MKFDMHIQVCWPVRFPSSTIKMRYNYKDVETELILQKAEQSEWHASQFESHRQIYECYLALANDSKEKDGKSGYDSKPILSYHFIREDRIKGAIEYERGPNRTLFVK